MSSLTPLAVRGCGMVTAAGFCAASTAAAVRAGVSGVARDNIWDPSAGDYMAVGRPRTPQWWEGPDHLAAIAAAAACECLDVLPKHVVPDSVPILLLLAPRERPHREPDLEQIVLSELGRRLGCAVPSGSQVFGGGRTSLLDALELVDTMLRARTAQHVVVVAVDSFLRQRVVDAYIERRRVLTSDNPNGFIPGEAACAVLLGLPDDKERPELRIVGYGRGHEPGTIDGEDPLTGDGLTAALGEALDQAGIGMAQTDYWLTDQNAEAYKAKECTVAQIRLERRGQPAPRPYAIQHPIEFLGEIGSAIGPCLLGLDLLAHRGGYARGSRALLSLGEDDGERIALILQWTGGN